MVNLDNERCAFFMHTFLLNQSEDSCMIIQINLMVLSVNTKLCGHYGEKNYIWKAKNTEKKKCQLEYIAWSPNQAINSG
jgi:hypothetical protein